MITIGKTKIALGIFLLFTILFISQDSNAQVKRFCYISGFNSTGDPIDQCGYRLFSSLPQEQINSLEMHPLIHNVSVSDGQTYIILIDGAEDLVSGEEIIQYLELYENNLMINKATSIIYPDTNVAPLCVRDYISKNITGLYVAAGTLFTIDSDPRCPQ